MKKGFTLIEVLIVVIILGILATIAIPQFTRVVERARRGEALTHIAALQTGERLFQLENDAFTAVIANLDTVVPNPAKFWAYTIINVAAGPPPTFSVVATRSAGGAWAGQTIVLDQDGSWAASTYEFAPED